MDEDGGYWKWKFLPSPVKLGMSDSNALGSRDFGSHRGKPTWEDWEEKVKTMYPIRYFLVEELVPWIKRKYRQLVSEPLYWLKCHLHPKYRYHILDLRQPKVKGEYAYRYGWIDSDHQMVYALFNILNNFVEHEMSSWYCPSEEEIAEEPSLLSQRHKYMEVKAIHYWWNIERYRQDEAQAELVSKWHDAHRIGDSSEHQLWKDLEIIKKANQDKEEEMIARLLKVRGALWT